MTKNPIKSVTFWGLIVTLIGTLLTSFGAGEPVLAIFADPEVQSLVAQIVTYLGLGTAAVGRVKAKQPLGLGSKRRGFSEGKAMLLLAVLAAALAVMMGAILNGCGPVKGDQVNWTIHSMEPCSIDTKVDGEVVQELRVKGPCPKCLEGCR